MVRVIGIYMEGWSGKPVWEKKICHAMSDEEMKVGGHGLPIDGCSTTMNSLPVSQMSLHLHLCSEINTVRNIHTIRKILMASVHAEMLR